MYNVERVDDEVEAAAARVAMDQSGQAQIPFDSISNFSHLSIYLKKIENKKKLKLANKKKHWFVINQYIGGYLVWV